MEKQRRTPFGCLHISLLGRLRLAADGEPLDFLVRPKALTLLAYLLVHRARPSSRDGLAFLLWPDEPEETARSNLRRHLYVLRKALPPGNEPWLLVEGDSVQWNPAAKATLDIVEFERLSADTDPRAMEIYAGDLLEDLYDDWLQPHRERLRGVYLQTLSRLAARARERREPATAERILQRMLASDPYREDALRALMTVFYERGDRAGALRLFDSFKEKLDQEVGVQPMPETAALHERIVHNASLPALPVPHNLPLPTSTFVGRDEDVASLTALLQASRLVTIVGAGGVGKTRVAISVASNILEDFPDGVWLAELAPVDDPVRVIESLAAAIGLRDSGERPLRDSLLRYLQRRRMLIVVDSCEHVVAEVAKTAEMILRGSPETRLLTTSRESLRIKDEVAYRLPSLSFPLLGEAVTAASAMRFGAISLFVDRVSAGEPTFRVSEDSVPFIAEICRRLDGIPLAIELAAARARVLSIPSLAKRLDERFHILTGGSRTAMPRHQTLRALINWSYELLSEPELRLLRRVAIFSGGWTLEAAEAVCPDKGPARSNDARRNLPGGSLDAIDILDLLASLVDKSLVNADTSGKNSRYWLLESTRDYALEKLSESGERELLACRHAEWMADFADRADEVLWEAPIGRWLAEVQPELQNLRAAMAWSLGAEPGAAIAARIAGSLGPIWNGLRVEGRRWIGASHAALAIDAPKAIVAKLWLELGFLAVAKGKVEAAERAVAIFNSLGDEAGQAIANYVLAFGLLEMQRLEEAGTACDRALQLYRVLHRDRSRSYGNALTARAAILKAQGRLDESRGLLHEAVATYEIAGEDTEAARAAGQLAELEFAGGNAEAALEQVNRTLQALERASEVAYNSGQVHYINYRGLSLCNAAAYQLALGDVDHAYGAARAGLALSARFQDAVTTSVAIQHLGAIAVFRGDPRRAARLFGYVDAWYRNEGFEREFTEQKIYDIAMTSLHVQLPAGEIASLAKYGARLSEDQAVADALTVSLSGPANSQRDANRS